MASNKEYQLKEIPGEKIIYQGARAKISEDQYKTLPKDIKARFELVGSEQAEPAPAKEKK